MPVTVDDFVNDATVKACISELEVQFGEGGKGLLLSDVVDNEGHQYANLVQKGGGVLGVALVGYTYVLEKMGIRFIRLAGTSAGAINTALMTVMGDKHEAKSLKVLDIVCKLRFFDLVDGHPAAKWLIKNFITHADFATKVKRLLMFLVITFLVLLAGDFIFLKLQQSSPQLSIITTIFFIVSAVFIVLVGLLAGYIAYLLKRLKNSGYGINPGDFFYDWIKGHLLANGIKTVADLIAKAGKPVPDLHLRANVNNEAGIKDLNGDVTFIASELVTENKIEFPRMCDLFRKAGEIDTLQPAGFVRASMSIPVFFESYYIDKIPCSDDTIKAKWLELGEVDPPEKARFVDGGILSNFPINLFYNPNVITPRLPSLGIDLDDAKPDDTTKHAQSWSFGGYFYRIFNTIRFYYDKDFLIKNQFFKKGIGTIKLADFNWLNFFLEDKDKLEMFRRGARAATDFLLNFNWAEYKNERKDMRESLEIQTLGTVQKR